jgi:hypothetical protein
MRVPDWCWAFILPILALVGLGALWVGSVLTVELVRELWHQGVTGMGWS